MTNDELFNLISNKLKSKDWKKQPFNVFNACGIENQETAHSAFIANLLNPEGTHGCGNLFLIKFLDILKEKYQEIEIDKLLNDVWVETEHNEDGYGRFDIWIKSKKENAYMIIENKIDAGDGEKQLLNYSNFLNEKSKRFNEKRKGVLLYLTLNGRAAENNSTSDKVDLNKQNGYYSISYYREIKKWLAPFLNEDINIQIKYAIEQYLNLIDYLCLKAHLRENIISKGALIEQAIELLKYKYLTKQEMDFIKYLIYSFERIKNNDKK